MAVVLALESRPVLGIDGLLGSTKLEPRGLGLSEFKPIELPVSGLDKDSVSGPNRIAGSRWRWRDPQGVLRARGLRGSRSLSSGNLKLWGFMFAVC